MGAGKPFAGKPRNASTALRKKGRPARLLSASQSRPAGATAVPERLPTRSRCPETARQPGWPDGFPPTSRSRCLCMDDGRRRRERDSATLASRSEKRASSETGAGPLSRGPPRRNKAAMAGSDGRRSGRGGQPQPVPGGWFNPVIRPASAWKDGFTIAVVFDNTHTALRQGRGPPGSPQNSRIRPVNGRDDRSAPVTTLTSEADQVFHAWASLAGLRELASQPHPHLGILEIGWRRGWYRGPREADAPWQPRR